MAFITKRSVTTLVRVCLLLTAVVAFIYLVSFSLIATSSTGLNLSIRHKLHHFIGKDNQSVKPSFKSIIKEKMEIIRSNLRSAEGSNPPLDPLSPASLWLLLNEKGFLNASAANLRVRGLSSLKVQDIATNDKKERASVYLLFPDIIITGTYRFDHKKGSAKLEDQGKFFIKIKKWLTSWSAKIVSHSHKTLRISELTVDSRLENVSESFISKRLGKVLPENPGSPEKTMSSVLIERIKKEVDEKLYQILENIFEVDIIEKEDLTVASVEKALLDHHLRQKRQVPCEEGEDLDDYVDNIFALANRALRVAEPFSQFIPNVTVEVPEFNLIIFLHSGGVTHAYTLRRKKPAWVFCSNDTISLGLTVAFDEVRVMYKYRLIQDWQLLFDGDLEAQIVKPKVQLQFTQSIPPEDSEEQVMQRIERVRIWDLGHIRLMVRGLGNLSQAISLFLTGFINRNIDSFGPTIRDAERQVVTLGNMMLQNISIPFLSLF